MDLNALILNCTLKKSPEPSNTQGLIEMVTAHFDELGVKHQTLRPVDFEIPFGAGAARRHLHHDQRRRPVPALRLTHLGCAIPPNADDAASSSSIRSPEGTTVPGWQPDPKRTNR